MTSSVDTAEIAEVAARATTGHLGAAMRSPPSRIRCSMRAGRRHHRGRMDRGGSLGSLDGSRALSEHRQRLHHRRQHTLSSQIAGLVRSVAIHDYQFVHAGDLIAEIDPADYLAQRDLAEADLSAARATLASISDSMRSSARSSIRPRLASRLLKPRS